MSYIHMKTCTSHAKLFKNYLHSTKIHNDTCKTLIIKENQTSTETYAHKMNKKSVKVIIRSKIYNLNKNDW